MAIQKLGKVSIMAKGNYISSEIYEKLDLVTFNGASYLCKKTCSGIEPIPGADTEYWQPFGQSVVVASQDKTGIVRPDGTSLVVKDSVTGRIGVGDARYIPFENEIMDADNVSNALVELKTKMNEVQENISDVWNASNTYLVGKYCIYNNSLWKCKVQHTNQIPTEGTYWTKVSVANEISSVNSNLESVNSSLSTWDKANLSTYNCSSGNNAFYKNPNGLINLVLYCFTDKEYVTGVAYHITDFSNAYFPKTIRSVPFIIMSNNKPYFAELLFQINGNSDNWELSIVNRSSENLPAGSYIGLNITYLHE